MEAFDKINIQDNDPSRILPYFNSSEGTSLPNHSSNLQRGISNLRNYIRREIPTQEVLDLYVSAVTWLLAYHKASHLLSMRMFCSEPEIGTSGDHNPPFIPGSFSFGKPSNL